LPYAFPLSFIFLSGMPPPTTSFCFECFLLHQSLLKLLSPHRQIPLYKIKPAPDTPTHLEHEYWSIPYYCPKTDSTTILIQTTTTTLFSILPTRLTPFYCQNNNIDGPSLEHYSLGPNTNFKHSFSLMLLIDTKLQRPDESFLSLCCGPVKLEVIESVVLVQLRAFQTCNVRRRH
jgi:hypothetical protein